MRNDKDNLIVDMTFKFALEIVDFTELLNQNTFYLINYLNQEQVLAQM